jgi:hypothetical protein
MRKTDNGAGPPAGPGYRLPEDGPLPDLPLYERLIADGIAAADRRGGIVDHVAARRLAIWLAAPPANPRTSPTAWSTAPKPEPSTRSSRPNCASRPAPPPTGPAASRQAAEIRH